MDNKFHSYSDEELSALSKSGADDAYSVLSGRYLFAIRSRAANYEHSGIDFEDLVQEGFIGLMNAVKCYEPSFDTSFSTFAFLCIDRNILSAVRKTLTKKQIPKSALVFIDENSTIEGSIADNPESVVISRENINILKKKVAENLSETERDVLSLYLSGFSYMQIAKKLDRSVKAVDNAVQRLRKKLK